MDSEQDKQQYEADARPGLVSYRLPWLTSP